MNDQKFYRKDFIFVIKFLSDFRETCNSSRIHKEAAVWIFREFLTGPVPADINARLALSLNEASRYVDTTTSYSCVIKNLLRCYFTDSWIAESDDEIRKFKQWSLTWWDFPQNLFDFTVKYEGLYDVKALCAMFVEGIDLSNRSTLRQWWGSSRVATPEEHPC